MPRRLNECTACGDCIERCPMDAIQEADNVSEVTAGRCIGCGVCYPSCTTESITLVARPEEDQTPALPEMELVTKVMSDKQREFRF